MNFIGKSLGVSVDYVFELFYLRGVEYILIVFIFGEVLGGVVVLIFWYLRFIVYRGKKGGLGMRVSF